MAHTVQQVQEQAEVWQNTNAGTRWYVCLDIQGRQITKTVRGNRTFTISTFERQLNQQLTANIDQDLFRNGTFVMKKASSQTVADEVASPNSLTDNEVLSLVNELTYGQLEPATLLQGISSDVTLSRILEALVIEDAPAKVRDAVKARQAAISTPSSGRHMSEPVKTKPDDEFDAIKAAVVVASLPDEPVVKAHESQSDDSGSTEGDG